MASLNGGPFAPISSLQYRSALDETTLARFFNAVYAWMAVGLTVTAVTSFAVFSLVDPASPLFSRGVGIVLFIIQIGLVFAIAGAIQRIPTSVATGLFLLYAALMGVSLSILFFAFTRVALATTFIETAGAFGVMSVYGLVTKRDLTRFGSLLIMAFIGIIIASVVNAFLMSPMLYWIVSYVGVAVFVGLTAYDTQRLKMIAEQTSGNPSMASRMAIVGSLTLYLDFINLFLFILQAFNSRRD